MFHFQNHRRRFSVKGTSKGEISVPTAEEKRMKPQEQKLSELAGKLYSLEHEVGELRKLTESLHATVDKQKEQIEISKFVSRFAIAISEKWAEFFCHLGRS